MLDAKQLNELKHLLKQELARRNGEGNVDHFADSKYDFIHNPELGDDITEEHGQKTIDLLLKICDYKDLKPVKQGDVIPDAFDENLLDFVRKLSQEERTGETEETVRTMFPDRVPETSSCRASCTGLCIGLCSSNCNGCIGCTGCTGSGANDIAGEIGKQVSCSNTTNSVGDSITSGTSGTLGE